MLLDRILPDYQFHEIHSVPVDGPAGRVFAQLAAITPAELPLLRLLMGLGHCRQGPSAAVRCFRELLR